MEYLLFRLKKKGTSECYGGMNLEDIMVKEISQSQKDKHYRISYVRISRVIKHRNRNRMVAARG